MSEKAPVFAGSIPGNYHQYIVPLFSEDYAVDLAQRLDVPSGGGVLDLAWSPSISEARCLLQPAWWRRT